MCILSTFKILFLNNDLLFCMTVGRLGGPCATKGVGCHSCGCSQTAAGWGRKVPDGSFTSAGS